MPAIVNTMAEEAAGAAVDMTGGDWSMLPGALTAYSFIHQLHYEEPELGAYPQLTRREYRQFRHDYSRHLRALGVPVEIAVAA